MKVLVFYNKEAEKFQVRSWEGNYTHATYLKENKIPFEDVSSTGQAFYSSAKNDWIVRTLDPWDGREQRLEIDRKIIQNHLRKVYSVEKMAQDKAALDSYWKILERRSER